MLYRQPQESMDPEMQKILREPFPQGLIGKLPKITCRDCSKAQNRVCNRHQKQDCQVCKNWITTQHMHVDYVGHAAITDRLLKADPNWSWEPAYREVPPQVLAAAAASGDSDVVAMVLENSPPLQEPTGMWIKLTVGGVTRLGYGNDDDPGPDHDKKLIGDAIRNAAMRFGVGLDLWSKEDLGSEESTAVRPDRPPAAPARNGRRDWISEADACTDLESLLRLGQQCNDAGEFVNGTKVALLRRRRELTPSSEAGAEQLSPTRQ